MIELQRVKKVFGNRPAVDDLNLTVKSGEIFGLLGHNGAGKTTLLGVLSTLVRPNTGEVRYKSGDKAVEGDELRRQIGMLAHSSLCYGELSALENLEFIAGLYDVDGSEKALNAVLDQVGLDKRARTRGARTYSRGMLQRLALARALLTKPSLLLLDEPFTGLDRDGALNLGNQLGALKEGGAIVVVVTHDLEAIAGKTDHLAILRRGALVFEDRADTYSYERLKDLYHQHAN